MGLGDHYQIAYGQPCDRVAQHYLNCMIEFAQMHVEKALKEASEKAKIQKEYYGSGQKHSVKYIGEHDYKIEVDRESILSSYPPLNIN